MKFIPRSSATRTRPQRLAEVDLAELLPERRRAEAEDGDGRGRSCRAGRRSMVIAPRHRLDHARLRPRAQLELARQLVERHAVRDPRARVDPAVLDQLDDPA